MKKFFKSAISIIAIITTIAYVSPVYAISNKETIYSIINQINSYHTYPRKIDTEIIKEIVDNNIK